MATVLVVDDNATHRDLVVTLLKYAGHAALEAGDGRDALRQVRQARPAMVICDLLMPNMDGYEFVRQLRAEPEVADTVVVFYSATFLEAEARALAAACGVKHVLTKPCEPDVILRTVELALQGATPITLQPDDGQFDRQHVRLLTDKLAVKVSELERSNERLAALTELGLRLASEHEAQALLDLVCSGARELLGARHALLALREHTEGPVRFAGSGLSEAEHAQFQAFDFNRPEARARLRDVVAQRHGAAPLARLPDGFPVTPQQADSAVVVPVQSPRRRYGWLLLVHKLGADAFEAEDLALLSTCAAQAGRMYESASLYEALQTSAASLRRAQALARLAHVVTRTDGTLESWSESLPGLIGVAPDQIPRNLRAWLALLHPQDQAPFRALARRASADGVGSTLAYRLLRRDGVWIHLQQEVEPLPLRADDKGQRRWFSTLQDVSEQRQAEQRIRRLSRLFEMLSGINALIVRVTRREELFREACRMAVEVGGYSVAWIALRQPDGHEPALEACHGADSDLAELLACSAQADTPQAQLPASRALISSQPVFCNDIRLEASLQAQRKAMLTHGLLAQASVPLIDDGKALGVLTLLADEVDVFDGPEMRLLIELAGDVSFAFRQIRRDERINYLAFFDGLTGLPNGELLTERLGQAIATAQVEHQAVALVFMDLERFNDINQAFGRHGGDALLQQLAERLRQGLQGREQVARTGGDQFALVLPDFQRAADVARRLADCHAGWFDAPFIVDGQPLRMAARMGISIYPDDGADAPALLRHAESAVKSARGAQQRVFFYDPRISRAVSEKLALEARLRSALERQEFVLYYQVKVDVDTRRSEGVEALIRWNSPELGLVAPLQFIPLLEETGLIVEVGLWALGRAVQDFARWQALGQAAPRIAVNVSAAQLRRPDFVASVVELLEAHGSPQGIDLELTESLLMEDISGTIIKLQALRARGLRLSIDDFGTGYSSLAYLSQLPAEFLKIDRTFISTMLDDPNQMALVSTMISLAHSLRMKAVAEGVETEEQAKILRLLRCDQMQGYLIGRPVPFEQFTLEPREPG